MALKKSTVAKLIANGMLIKGEAVQQFALIDGVGEKEFSSSEFRDS